MLANQPTGSLLSLEPPDFPDMLYYFRQSLATSQTLRHLVTDVENVPEMPCVCRELSLVNWTRFGEHPAAREWMSALMMTDCVVEQDRDVKRPMIVVGNWTLESKPEASGLVDQGRALVIGISACLAVALSVGAILVVFR